MHSGLVLLHVGGLQSRPIAVSVAITLALGARNLAPEAVESGASGEWK
jgi:hypothetical protein